VEANHAVLMRMESADFPFHPADPPEPGFPSKAPPSARDFFFIDIPRPPPLFLSRLFKSCPTERGA